METKIPGRTPEEIEAYWFKNVYKGDSQPQLTLRAILMGSFLGGFMALSNLYVGLKTGWGLGVAITACILSFSIFRTLRTLLPGIFKTEMSILENNCMQSTASSAGAATGSVMVSVIPALLLITGHHMNGPILAAWIFFLATLGVFLAIPLKRQMINTEQLAFPSGTAAAVTLDSLHSEGKNAVDQARSLGFSGVIGSLITWFRDAGKPFSIPGQIHFPGSLGGYELAKWTISFELSTVMIAAGAIMGWKIAWSMLLGAIINFGVLAPQMVQLGAIDPAKLGYRAIVTWSTWTGVAIMVTSGLLQFFMQGKMILRAFHGLLPKAHGAAHDPLERIEVPPTWFLWGFSISAIACAIIINVAFGTPIWMGLLAALLSFFLGIVACRATGETDITPIGAMGKITQLTYGFLAPGNMVTNIATAGVTSGSAGAAADLLNDLKSGYLLGANPRKQFIAQFLGTFMGVAVVVPAFYILVPDGSVLGTDKWPAPAAQVWSAVAKLLANGIGSLHYTAQMGMVIGAIVGILIPVADRLAPKSLKPFIPSATGLGLAFVIPFFNSLSMFIGAAIALIVSKKATAVSEKYLYPVSSGFIAGESIMGIIVALLSAAGII